VLCRASQIRRPQLEILQVVFLRGVTSLIVSYLHSKEERENCLQRMKCPIHVFLTLK